MNDVSKTFLTFEHYLLVKIHVFWEGHKILKSLTFFWCNTMWCYFFQSFLTFSEYRTANPMNPDFYRTANPMNPDLKKIKLVDFQSCKSAFFSIMIYQTNQIWADERIRKFCQQKIGFVDSGLGVGCSDEQVSDNFFGANKSIEFLFQFWNTNFSI